MYITLSSSSVVINAILTTFEPANFPLRKYLNPKNNYNHIFKNEIATGWQAMHSFFSLDINFGRLF